MRVVHFVVGRCNPNSANGVDQAVYHLSRTQAALSAQVAVFSLTAKPPVDVPGVSVHPYPPTALPFTLPGALLSDLAAWRPDVVHLHSVYTPSNAGLAAWLARRRIPYVVTPHGGLSRHVLARRWYLKLPYRWAFELRLLNRAMFVHALADEGDIRRYGVSVPIVTAPNGMDLSAVPSGCNRELLLSRVPGARGKRVYMFLGRLDPLHKGLDVLLEGFALARLDDAVLVLVGPDWRGRRTALERLTHRLGIATQTAFVGPAYGREKFDLLAGADVFVHPSRWEGGMPLAVLEAAASAKPCLVTAAADPRGLISKLEAGVVIEASAESIAEGLSRFASLSVGDLEAMGARARQMVEVEFDWARTARTILDAYQAYAQGARVNAVR